VAPVRAEYSLALPVGKRHPAPVAPSVIAAAAPFVQQSVRKGGRGETEIRVRITGIRVPINGNKGTDKRNKGAHERE
jgi:hypothetical protein